MYILYIYVSNEQTINKQEDKREQNVSIKHLRHQFNGKSDFRWSQESWGHGRQIRGIVRRNENHGFEQYAKI